MQMAKGEGTFITNGSEDPNQLCDNCSQQVAKQSFQLHYTYCVKNISKCPFCLEPFQTKELQEHVEEMKGDDDAIKTLAQEGKFEELKKFLVHGANVLSFKDKENWNNSLLHVASKANNKELIQFLYQNNVDLDQ